MRWLTIEQIRTQCRIDHDFLDEELIGYAEAAEAYVMNYTRRDEDELMYDYRFPMVKQAALMLIAYWEDQKASAVSVNYQCAPFSVDALLKPLRRLV